MIPFCVVLGIAVVGERDPLGVAHLTLLPLEILGLSLLAATFPLRRTVLIFLMAGCLIDFSGGILLHAHVESLENDSQRPVFSGLNITGGRGSLEVVTSTSLSGVAWDNWFLKHEYALNTEKLDELSRYRPANAATGRAQMQKALRDDEVYWHGWYARNEGTVEFLGDHTAGASTWAMTVLASMLVLLAIGLVRATLLYGRASPARNVGDLFSSRGLVSARARR